MRSIKGLILGLGLGVFLSCGWTSAQEGSQPAVIVLVGADGSVRIIDAKTGKEIANIAAKAQPKPGAGKAEEAQRLQAEKQLLEARKELEKLLHSQQKVQIAPPLQIIRGQDKIEVKPMKVRIVQDGVIRVPGTPVVPQPNVPGGLDKKQIEQLQKYLERILQEEKAAKPDSANKYRARPLVIELDLQTDPLPNQPKVLKIDKVQRFSEPGSVDKKLDLILKQLDDLRKDVDGIKKKLDGKKPDPINFWQVVPNPKAAKDKKPGVFEFEIELTPRLPKDAKPDQPRFEIKPILPPGKEVERKPAVRQVVPANPYSNPEVIKQLNELIKQLEEKEKAAKPAPPRPPMPTEAQRLEELQRALERIRQEVDELKKSKSSK